MTGSENGFKQVTYGFTVLSYWIWPINMLGSIWFHGAFAVAAFLPEPFAPGRPVKKGLREPRSAAGPAAPGWR